MAVVAAVVAAGASVVAGAVGANQAKQAAKGARGRAAAAAAEVEALKAKRQTVINPYAGVKDLSTMAQDLSSQITNPYNQLGVATKAAEMQAEEADIALANTLDTLRATGASAGGATALAQAALKSKQGISANIEQQEAQNEKLRAQGELAQNQAKVSEAQRLQQANIQGRSFEFGVREQREVAQMDRVAAQLSGAEAREAQAQADRTGAITTAIGGVTEGVATMAKAGVFKKKVI